MTLSRSVQAIIVALGLVGVAAARGESEATVKAAYLVNFAKVTDWPASAFAGGKSALIIGVVGRSAEGDEVARTMAGASANGRPVEVRRMAAGDGSALAACHLLFVPEGENAEAVVNAVRGKPVLVVGEADGFVRRGGALGFVKEGGTLKFDASPQAAAGNGLALSAKLLRVARTVMNK